MGITGSWEGFYAGDKEIYNRGTWGNGYSLSQIAPTKCANTSSGSSLCTVSQDSSTLRLNNIGSKYCAIYINKAVNFSAYQTLNVVASCAKVEQVINLYVLDSKPPEFLDNAVYIRRPQVRAVEGYKEYTLSASLSDINLSGYLAVSFHTFIDGYRYIHRIYFA